MAKFTLSDVRDTRLTDAAGAWKALGATDKRLFLPALRAGREGLQHIFYRGAHRGQDVRVAASPELASIDAWYDNQGLRRSGLEGLWGCAVKVASLATPKFKFERVITE